MQVTRRVLPWGAGLILIAATTAAGAADPDLQARMHGLFGALAQLSETMQGSGLEDARNRESVEQLLGILAADAGQISQHAEPYRGDGFRILAGSLASDAEQAMVRFEAGDIPTTERAARGLSDACFACHSTLPGTASAKAVELPPSVASLPPAERMRWSVVAREFGAALKLGEEALLSKATSASDLDRNGVLEDYLVVAIRVRGDLKTPRGVLGEFEKRKDFPPDLKPVLDAWIDALAVLDPLPYSRPKLETAQEILADAPADRRGIAHVVAASALLHQYVQSAPKDPAVAAEAYYLLGSAENRIRGTRDPRAACVNLEACIRLVPGTTAARDAYELLDSITTGGEISPTLETREHLNELRDLATPK